MRGLMTLIPLNALTFVIKRQRPANILILCARTHSHRISGLKEKEEAKKRVACQQSSKSITLPMISWTSAFSFIWSDITVLLFFFSSSRYFFCFAYIQSHSQICVCHSSIDDMTHAKFKRNQTYWCAQQKTFIPLGTVAKLWNVIVACLVSCIQL